jgi:4-alpha-glucanotransferase
MPGAPGKPMTPPIAAHVASLNTHDTATFAGWWRGGDIDDRRALGLITPAQEAAEHVERAAARAAVLALAGAKPVDDPSDAACALALAACTRVMAESPAHVVLVTVEDLWLEPQTQNVPGTTDQRPNWRRPWSRSLEDVLADPAIGAALDDVAVRRAGVVAPAGE